MMRDLVVWVGDVGSIRRGNFGWCRMPVGDGETEEGTAIDQMATRIAEDLSVGSQVALGFECPLFVPISLEPRSLTSARVGEKTAWSAISASGALVVGLAETVWILERLGEQSAVEIRPTLGWQTFVRGDANLLVWEAYVSGAAKVGSHSGDARVAAQSFLDACRGDIEVTNAVTAAHPFSLVGAALLRAGLASDTRLLHQARVVVKS